MTANELVDKLQELDSKLHLIELFKAATMLRQQQAEIEALKADTIPYRDLHQVVKNVLAQPMRELTDEEIMQFQDKVPYTLGSDLIDFARAILKKASEK